MKHVLTYGTFDILHIGHINLLRRARALGDHLTVGLSTDEFNTLKNKKALLSYEDRKEALSALRFVDAIIPETSWEQKKDDIREHKIDIFVMGSDWEGKFDELQNLCEVIYLPRTEHISSTILREIMQP